MSVNTRTSGSPRFRNQQVFELDYEPIKRDIIELDLQIGQEIDSMADQVRNFDALKVHCIRKSQDLEVVKSALKVANAEDKWSTVLTGLELAETLLCHAQTEKAGQERNLEADKEVLSVQQCQLGNLCRQKDEATQKSVTSKREFMNQMEQLYHEHEKLLGTKQNTIEQKTKQVGNLTSAMQTKRSDLAKELHDIASARCDLEDRIQQVENQKSSAEQELRIHEAKLDDQLREIQTQICCVREQRKKRRENHLSDLKSLEVDRTGKLEQERCSAKQCLKQTLEKYSGAEEDYRGKKAAYDDALCEDERAKSGVEQAKETLRCAVVRTDRKKKSLNEKLRAEERYCDCVLENVQNDLKRIQEEVKVQHERLRALEDEKRIIEEQTKRIYSDMKEAQNMSGDLHKRLEQQHERKERDQSRTRKMDKWRHSLMKANATTPHLHLDRLRKQMQGMTQQLDDFDQQERREIVSKNTLAS